MIETARAATRTSSWPQYPAFSPAVRTGYLIVCVRLLAAGLALAVQIALARRLGDVGYGEFAVVVAWLQLMLVFADGGFATAALRYVAAYQACAQLGRLRGFLARSTQISAVVSLLLGLVLALAAVALHRPESTYSATSFLLAGAALPLMSQVVLRSAVVRGFGDVVPSMLLNLVQPAFLLSALMIVPLLISAEITVTAALALQLTGALLAVGIAVRMGQRFEPALTSEPRSEFLTREWLSTASLMLVASSLIYLQGRTGVIFSGMLLDARAAGGYAIVEKMADLALFGLISINLLVAPKFAALHAQRQHEQLRRCARLSAGGATAFMLLTVVPLVIFGKQVLHVFGEDFVFAYPALLILLAGVSVNALCGSVGFLLSMTGHQRDTVCIALVSLGVNLVLSLLLIPAYGIEGTAAANAISMVTWNVMMLLCVKWRLGIWACLGRDRQA